MIPNGIRVVGTATPVPEPLRVTISRLSGNRWVFSARGLASEVYALFIAKKAGALEADFVQNPGEATARVTLTYANSQDGSPEVSQDTVDLDWHELRLSIFQRPAFCQLQASRIATILRTVEFAKTPGRLQSEIDAEVHAQSIDVGNDTEMRAFNLLLAGVEHFTCYIPVLTYTHTVGPAFPTPFVVAFNGLIFSDDQLAGYLGDAAVLFSIQKVQQAKFLGASATAHLGWMRKGKFDWLANGNCQMIEVFEFGAWESDLYDLAPGYSALPTS